MRPRTSVFLIDDHPIVEAGLRLGISLQDRFVLAGSATSHDRALAEMALLRPDVIVTDLIMAGEMTLDVIEVYREILPETFIAVFSSLKVAQVATRCRHAGADAFFSKDTSPHELLLEIAARLDERQGDPASIGAAVGIASGGSGAGGSLIVAMDGKRLTPRESEVARRLAYGAPLRQIADELRISPKTAGVHRDNIKAKLGCASTGELIALLARQPLDAED